MESNDSLEIPDRGETSDIPDLPSGAGNADDVLKKAKFPAAGKAHKAIFRGVK